MSTIKDIGVPPRVVPAGTSKGRMVVATPETRTRLKRFAPMILPRESAPWPFIRAVIAVTSSGRDVPRATKVSEITVSGTPIAAAIAIPLSTRRSAPTAITAAPMIRKRIDRFLCV